MASLTTNVSHSGRDRHQRALREDDPRDGLRRVCTERERRSATARRSSAAFHGGEPHPRVVSALGDGAGGPASSRSDARRQAQLVITALVALLVAVVMMTVIALLGALGQSFDSARESATRALAPYWTVRRGQTYSLIAAKTGLSIDELETFNPYQNPDTLRPGQHIRLRLHPPPLHRKRPGPRVWIVRRGQTFASIAAKTDHSIYALQRLNPRLEATALQPGQRMKLRP